jgi:DNA invertase Pin-like site-specific DNA recombinase
MFLGTRRDNMQDCHQKGRYSRASQNQGVTNYGAKLTDEHVQEIRRAHANGSRQRTIANAYGISQQTVSRIVRRKLWKHLS